MTNSRKNKGARSAFFCALLFALGGCVEAPVSDVRRPSSVLRSPSSGWGIDACLTAHVPESERGAYLQLLGQSSVTWLRERQPNPGIAQLKAAGFQVVSFLGDLHAGNVRPDDVLPGDLLAVFHGAKALARSSDARNVEAWEMVGEPDVGYCRDLPDRLVAFQKAVYLGLKAGAAEADDPASPKATQGAADDGAGHRPSTFNSQRSTARAPLVLMGALALPPGPWLERAVKNGLLDYTDAYNFHFYGNAEDLSGVIAAHDRIAKRVASDDRSQMAEGRPTSAFIARLTSVFHRLSSVIRHPSSVVRTPSSGLPLWITECGMNAVTTDDFLNPARRQLQAEFTIKTAEQALAAPAVAMFMPFILVERNDPFAVTLAADKPLPAWDNYARFTREHPWPKRPLAALPKAPNPVVVQWMPDAGAAVAHKISGTYRFWQRRPMHGEIRIYNFSNQPVLGRLLSSVPATLRDSKSPSDATDLTVPAEGRVIVPITFTAPASGYVSEECKFVFKDSSGGESRASFGVETWPEAKDFVEHPLALRPLSKRQIRFPQFQTYEHGDIAGVWQAINGLQVAMTAGGKGADFWTDHLVSDPLRPTMAFAAIEGVPEDGFLRMQLDQPMGPGRAVKVDLVDEDGQRFCIWENLGQSYFVKSSEVWLNLHDLGIYFWGRCTNDPKFHPERVREIQLRFLDKTPGERTRVQLSWMVPR